MAPKVEVVILDGTDSESEAMEEAASEEDVHECGVCEQCKLKADDDSSSESEQETSESEPESSDSEKEEDGEMGLCETCVYERDNNMIIRGGFLCSSMFCLDASPICGIVFTNHYVFD